MTYDIKLPKDLVKQKVDEQICSILENSLQPVSEGSETKIPCIELTQKVRSHIFYAGKTKHAVFGFESIEQTLAKELHGLEKMGTIPNRISRLLIVSNDGSDRFYRQLEFVEKSHGQRVMFIKVDVDSDKLAQTLGLKGKKIKSVLITHKDSVCNILKQLL